VQRVTWKSPSGAYYAHVREKPHEPFEPEGILLLEISNHRSVVFALPIERNVELSWSSEEREAALLDNFASNENRIMVADLPSGQVRLEISRENASLLNSNLPPATEYSHVYFSKLAWVKPRNIRVFVRMYDRLSHSVPKDYEGTCEFVLKP